MEPGQLLPYGPIEILPGARALHFAEQAFEGMKAYRVGRPVANLFRAGDNYARFKRSAERIAMTPVPETLFYEGIEAVVAACTPFVPDKSGQSLYLRPFLFGTEPGYAVRASEQRSLHGHRQSVRPSGSVVARVFLTANPSVYTPVHESIAHCWREKEMIQPHPLV